MPFLFFASVAAGDRGQALRDETDNSLADEKKKKGAGTPRPAAGAGQVYEQKLRRMK